MGDAPPFRLLPGEVLLETAPGVTHNCHYDGAVRGTLFLTNFKLVFQSLDSADSPGKRVFNDWKGNVYTTFRYSDKPGPEVPLGMITRVDKMGNASSKRENGYGIEVHCNDFRTLRFGFPAENHARRPFFEALQAAAFPLSAASGDKGAPAPTTPPPTLFAYVNGETFDESVNGWEVYDLREELQRQGVAFDAGAAWRVTEINAKYELCETYPPLLAVPAAVSDEDLKVVASFRSKGRLPMLVWVHPKHKVSLTRCSQPQVGLWRRNQQDEAFIRALRTQQSPSAKLFIIDARPRANAYANQMNGAGFESTEVYENTEILFMNIDNIHVMRDSLRKLRDCCFPFVAESSWFVSVEASRWLDHLRLVITAAVRIVDLMDRGKHPCLVHCSDGWDRTAQLTSLATMMMDPFYRTLRGFAILVEKEWVHAGHQFSLRTGQGNKNHGDDQRAPIFLQFLDCVYQLTVQFPTAFEFNTQFLVTLADELYSGRFGTFLHNSDKQRAEAKRTTKSLWSFVLAKAHYRTFANPVYFPALSVLQPIPSLRRLRVWTEYYARWTPQLAREDDAIVRQWQLQTYVNSLDARIDDASSAPSTPRRGEPVSAAV